MLLVTGASGLLGANLLSVARGLGHDAAGITNQHALQVPGTKSFQADLTESGPTRELISSLKPTQIIHCAAATNVDWCEDHPHEAEKINAHASGVLAEIACELGAQFVYISTDSVFNGERGCYGEGDEPGPVNCYAKSKLLGEQAALRSHPGALIVRVNIYGWNVQPKLSLAEWILQQLRASETVPGFTDVSFTPILVNDLSERLLMMLAQRLTGTYHVSGSEKVTKYEFARRVAAVFGFDDAKVLPTQLAEARLRAPRPRNTSLDTVKISSVLGSAMPSVDEGLHRFRALEQQGYVNQLKNHLRGNC